MSEPAIIEAAFNSLWTNTRLNEVILSPDLLHTLAEKVTAYIAPLIRAGALERAAKVAEGQRLASGDRTEHWQAACRQRQQWLKDQIADAIRALKEQP